MFSAAQSALSKHASQAVQHLSTVHWLHAVAGVLTGFLHDPVVGGLDAPVPMPLHCAMQFFPQHVSMPLPIAAPAGCCDSHLLRHAATGSPPLVPEVPLDVPEVPLEVPEVPEVPVPDVPELVPDEPLDVPLVPLELALEVDPSPGPELLEHATWSPLTAQVTRTVSKRLDVIGNLPASVARSHGTRWIPVAASNRPPLPLTGCIRLSESWPAEALAAPFCSTLAGLSRGR